MFRRPNNIPNSALPGGHSSDSSRSKSMPSCLQWNKIIYMNEWSTPHGHPLPMCPLHSPGCGLIKWLQIWNHAKSKIKHKHPKLWTTFHHWLCSLGHDELIIFYDAYRLIGQTQPIHPIILARLPLRLIEGGISWTSRLIKKTQI